MRKFPLVLATVGLTASLGAFAAIPTDAAPFQLVIPNLKSGFDITLEGLLLQPSNSDLDYATSGTVKATSNTDNLPLTWTSVGKANVESIDPSYNFGFRVGLGYTFAESGNDVQVSWTHFDQSDDDSFGLANGAALQSRLTGTTFLSLAPFSLDLGDDEGIAFKNITGSASSSVDTKLDAIDLDVGQYVDIGTRLRMRMFAGLRFAQVSSDMSSDFYQTVSGTVVRSEEPDINFDGALALNEQFNSRFRGIGPRVGVDSIYHIGSCFGVVARAAVGLLVGQTETDSSYSAAGVLFVDQERSNRREFARFADGATLDSSDSTRVVPVLDAKLGLNYSFIFDNQSTLTIEAGYQATQYIDAIDRLSASGTVNLPDFDGIDPGLSPSDRSPVAIPVAVSSSRTTSSIGFNGPYLSLNWKV
jgi:hypothetical protein